MAIANFKLISISLLPLGKQIVSRTDRGLSRPSPVESAV
jgi:uncharacterized membrane protein YccF (DUF307 family)